MATRRDFLKALGSSAIISLGAATPPAFLRAAAAAGIGDARLETVLVMVQLTGGNDGLNTVVPYTDEIYRRSRPVLAIPAADVLKINGTLGFHPTMRGMADLLEAGQLAIVQGVGYPQPNRSHFESMDIWHTCQRKGSPRTTGWLGRYLDQSHTNTGGDSPAMHLGSGKQPLALAAERVRSPSISSLDRFRLEDGGDAQLRSAIEDLSGEQTRAGDDLLGFIQTSTASALQAGRRVEEARKEYKTAVNYPNNHLAENLRTVAQLIDAGLSTRVYYLELDGFDTHSQQAAAHAALLNELSGALAAFLTDVTEHGHGERLAVMAFSEFGRRVAENASEGTDHGAANPVLLAGGRIKAGLIGAPPRLDDLDDGDVKFHTDFRQVYAGLLERWLGWPSREVIGEEFQPVDVFA